MLAAADLDRLAAQRRVVLKDEPAVLVEVLGDVLGDVLGKVAGSGESAVVRKTYRNRGLRWLQSLLRKSRAEREHDHLAAIAATGVPCLQPLGWSAQRRLLGVDASTLLTRFVPDCAPLRDVLRASPPAAFRVRARLAHAMGKLVAALHGAGFLWCTPMPRNALVAGDPAAARLLVCDTPSCVDRGRDLRGSRLARVDLFLGAFSASRQRDWSRTERLRWLCGYVRDDREQARALWRTLVLRSQLQNVVVRALAMAWFTYILPSPRSRRPPTDR